LLPWPGCSSGFRDTTIKILKTKLPGAEAQSSNPLPHGSLILKDKHVLVACGENGTERLELIEVQPANRPKGKATDWANGVRLSDEDRLVSTALQRA
jgi:methionyl-tRNA formyltransferase